MGMCYYLYKPKSKELFELDKGNWSGIDFKKDQQRLYFQLLEETALTFDLDTTLGYFDWLATEIKKWIGDDEFIFINEENFFDGILNEEIKDKALLFDREYIEKNYPITGSRFAKQDHLDAWAMVLPYVSKEGLI